MNLYYHIYRMIYHTRMIMLMLILILSSVGSLSLDLTNKCTPVRIKFAPCQNLGAYNYTSMPNLAGQDNIDDAQEQFQTYDPLIKYKCSPKLVFFLCSVYMPMCDYKTNFMLGPCQPLCEEVRDSCTQILKTFKLSWPDSLRCSKFVKENGKGSMCMAGPIISSSNTVKATKIRDGSCRHLYQSQAYLYINRTAKCVPKCDTNILFRSDDKYLAKIWLSVLAVLCFISCFFTILTFLIDSDRFRYPERPVVFLAISYGLFSIANFIRLLNTFQNSACTKEPVSRTLILTQEGLDNTICAIVFLLNYYFTISAHIWWVCLTIGWFLAANFKWSEEAIYQKSAYFHLLAWLCSSLLTVSVLVLRWIDADELLGLCSVGQQNTKALMIFVIAPISLFLIIGCIFLLAGFIGLMRVRKHIKNGGLNTDKLEVLMVRIGVFSVLFVVPSVTVLGCCLYEYLFRERWMRGTVEPNIEVFMLKIFMQSVVGITSGVWVWSLKTLDSWKWFVLVRLCGKTPTHEMLLNRASATNMVPQYTSQKLIDEHKMTEPSSTTVELIPNQTAHIKNSYNTTINPKLSSNAAYTYPHTINSSGINSEL